MKAYRVLLHVFAGAMLVLALASGAIAQVGSASAALNGTVRDPSGAVVPRATITLTSVETGTKQVATTNSDGTYVFVNIPPGSYSAQAARQGFKTSEQPPFRLDVNQSSTLNFALQVGSPQTTVEVQAGGLHLQTSSAVLGIVIGQEEINSLPLNGRNFTQFLSLSPGTIPGGGGFANYIGDNNSQPSINGQSGRSNMWALDGVINYQDIRDTYATQPIIDNISQIKFQSHSDEAQFGGTLGGIVNVVTKSGTNQFHGTLWEFFNKDSLNASNYFNPTRTPVTSNHFGGNLGGPVLLPHYNGRNKTFFFVSYEGFRFSSSSESLLLTPTPAQLSGDMSNLEDLDEQLYNPYSSVPDDSYANGVFRAPFMCDSAGSPLPVNSQGVQPTGTPCDIIPPALLNQTMLFYAKSFFPKPQDTGNPNFNLRDTTPQTTTQNEMSVRIDEQLGSKDRLFGRYTGSWQPTKGSGGYPGFLSIETTDTYNIAANWTHTFDSSTVLQLTFGRSNGQFNTKNQFEHAPTDFLSQSGFAPYLFTHAATGDIIPGVNIAGYLGGGNYVMLANYADTWQYKGSLMKTIGRHSLQMGASLATIGWTQPFNGSEVDFDSPQTADGNGNGGDALASYLLGLPTYSEVDNVYSTLRGGKVIGGYFQDQWRATDKLTVNVGLRYDVTVHPREGRSSDGSDITGDFDLSNGTYILQNPAPACSPTRGAPCIPGGALPEHVVIAKNGKIAHDVYDNIQPRIGFAYRITPNLVMHGGYGRFFDNWALVAENQSNYTQAWPNVAFIATPGDINLGYPNGPANDPFGLGNTGKIEPFDSPFSPFNVNAYVDPNMKDAYADEFNFGFEQQLGTHATVTLNYVGSRTERVPEGITGNAAPAPGPGDPQERTPFPYIPQQPYMVSKGNSSYNALQASADIRYKSGLVSTIAYTYSRMIDLGGFQNPYDLEEGRAANGLTHVFTASFVYPLPFGLGQRWRTSNSFIDRLIGGWQLNGIVSLRSGGLYDVDSGDPTIPNTNNFYGVERADIVGNPHEGTTGANSLHPINTDAFAIPAPFTFGNMPRNSLTGPVYKNLDASLFRSIEITEDKRLEFRIEAFNALNYVIFGGPDTAMEDPNFGVVSSTGNSERNVNLAAKFYF